VRRLDPDSHARRDISVGATPTALACGASGVWAVGDDGRLRQLDPATNSVRRIVDVGAGTAAVAVAGDAVWVPNPLGGTVSRVAPDEGL